MFLRKVCRDLGVTHFITINSHHLFFPSFLEGKEGIIKCKLHVMKVSLLVKEFGQWTLGTNIRNMFMRLTMGAEDSVRNGLHSDQIRLAVS